MLRLIINIALALAYLLGFVLVWISLQTIAFELEEFVAATVGVCAGMAWWGLVTFVARRLSAGPLGRKDQARL